jgi:mannose-6-phosphate isomerase
VNVLPLVFRPIFKDRIWGGERLARVLGKPVPNGRRIGESWELVDLEEDRTVVAGGALLGRTLREAAGQLGAALVGSMPYAPPFPIQTRYIDAGDILSVQVHPGPGTCRRLGRGAPKAESWYIIDADPGAFLYKGLRPGTDERALRAALRDGSVVDLLVKVPVRAGECHHIPAGAVHAIGPGILIAEIQTPSDTTFRIHDWDRTDDAGRPRTLHVEDAMASIRWDLRAEDLTATTRGRLVTEESYVVDLRDAGPGAAARVGGTGQPLVLTVVQGGGLIRGTAAAGAVACRHGDTLLVPAAFEGEMESARGCTFLESTWTGRG